MQTLTHVLKLCSVMLVGFAFVDRIIRAFPMQPDQSFLRLFLPQDFFQFLGIFHMARLICNSLRAFILPRLTKFWHKRKQSKFSKKQLTLSPQCSLLTVLGLGLLLPCKDCFRPQCSLTIYLFPNTRCHFLC